MTVVPNPPPLSVLMVGASGKRGALYLKHLADRTDTKVTGVVVNSREPTLPEGTAPRHSESH
jgi:hypothetical protein